MSTHQLKIGLNAQFEQGAVQETASYIKDLIILNLLVKLEQLGAKILMEH